jgi:hypothetical protein
MDLMLENIKSTEKQVEEVVQSLDDKLANAGKRSSVTEKNEVVEEFIKE